MGPKLTPDEDQKIQEFVKIVNDIRLQHKTGPMSHGTALKFMMARKFDVHRALSLYEAHEITRFREGLARFDPTVEPLKSELDTGKFTVLPTKDSSGAAICMFTAYKHAPDTSLHKTTLQGVVYQLDVALEDEATQRAGIVFIYNMSSSKYSNFDYELSQKILGLLKGAYPARLKKVLIVTAPLWFKAPFKILRLFVREKLRDRVFMVGVNQLAQHIPRESLPYELGGKLTVDHQAWLSECLKASQKNKNELCDLASYNKYPLITNLNSAIDEDQNGSSGRLSDDEADLSASNDNQPQPNDNAVVNNSSTKPSSAPLNGNHETTTTPTNASRLAKLKPEKIIMPPEINNDGGDNVRIIERTAMAEVVHSENDEALSLEEFIQFMKQKSRKGLIDEYNEIKSKYTEGTFETARVRNNHHKNRYTDVLCYDHSRVKLNLTDGHEEATDYINANFVSGYGQQKAFISTQGPLPKTCEHFWKMIWDTDAVVIVCLTRMVERCRIKCHQYWPESVEDSVEYGQFKIFNNNVEQFTDYIITSLVLSDTKTGLTRELTHCYFTSWPDYGVPTSALAMLDFRDKVREYQTKGVTSLGSLWNGHALGPPIVVHCSAGIGRTGTFITLDISILRLEATGKINIRQTVEKIRSQRAYSIQMPDQYVFCYLALLEFALSRRLLEDVDLSGFDDESESEPEE